MRPLAKGLCNRYWLSAFPSMAAEADGKDDLAVLKCYR
jgi:hypothetical protein